jgi:hypothetical protein
LAPMRRKAVIVWTFVTADGLSKSSNHWLSVRPWSLGSRPSHIRSTRMPSALRSITASQTTFWRRRIIAVWSNDPSSATAATRRGDWNKSAMPPFATAHVRHVCDVVHALLRIIGWRA